MLFPTIEFAIFFALVFPLTWALNKRNELKKAMLVAVSYVFYGFWSMGFLLLLFFSSFLNFLVGRWLAATDDPKARKRIVAAAVAANLLPLCFFKYFDFLAAEIVSAGALFGLSWSPVSTGVAVPVAISFLTFHGISYVVDVYRGKVAASRSLVDLLLYIAFFPHLVAGPIVRAADFLDQLARPSRPQDIEIGKSVMLILGGLFKKVVIASHLSVLFVDPVFTNPAGYNSIDLILAVYAYAIVIYCDFSAYTDIAIGVADLLGYKFPQNFNQPYRALSLQDFWHRWHMTLSSWLRDYLYIPLGGNKKGRLLTYRNLILTMVLGGLWHGAGLQFIIWGALHGFGLAAERLLRESTDPDGRLRRFLRSEAGAALRWLLVFNVVCLAWVFFRSPDFTGAMDYLRAIRDGFGVATPLLATPLIVTLMMVGFLTQLLPASMHELARAAYGRISLPLKIGFGTSVIFFVTMLAPAGVAPFIYFQF